MDKIRKLWSGKKTSFAFAGASTVEKSDKAKGISRKNVEEALLAIRAYAYHRPRKRKFRTRFVYVPTLNYQFGADLLEVRHPKSNYNKHYILVVMDLFSRSAWMEALKQKTMDEVLKAIIKIMKRTKRSCKLFQSDDGREFINSKSKAYFKSKGIHHFSVGSEKKCCINERFNRTIGGRFARYKTFYKTKRFIQHLSMFESQYNNSYHRTIKCRPNQVTEENAPKIWLNIYERKLKDLGKEQKKPVFEVGDRVLIPAKKGTFAKGHDPNWGPSIFTVREISLGRPVTYCLNDDKGNEIKGSWYRQQLLKIPTWED